MSNQGFRFIDLPTAADRLGITRREMLAIVEEGRVKPFSGKGQQAVFRAAEIDRLAEAMRPAVDAGVEGVEVGDPDVDDQQAEAAQQGRPRKRRDPIKLIGTRISMDSRWAEITDEDFLTWLDALEPVQYERVRKVAALTMERLNKMLDFMDKQQISRSKLLAVPDTTRDQTGEGHG